MPSPKQVRRDRAAETGRSPEDFRREHLGKAVLGRMVGAEDVAAPGAFLASDEAITGQAIDVSAGYGL